MDNPTLKVITSGARKTGRVTVILASVALGFLLINPFVIIGAGERGVALNLGAVQEDVMFEGLHLRVPLMQQVGKDGCQGTEVTDRG